jgi:glycosyltransferase involved in cell wall biosynthesis
MPYVLLEAISAGLPIVSTKVGGVKDLIREGVNGYLVQPEDPNELYQKLFELTISEEKRVIFGTKSKKLADYYSVDRMVEQTIEVYKEAIRNYSPNRRAKSILVMEERNL